MIGANGAETLRASQWLAKTCQQREVPKAQFERIEICLAEVLANVIEHGGQTALVAPIRLRLEVSLDEDGCKASVTVSDFGVAFDPLSVPKKILPKTLDESTPGGLGLVLLRSCSDWVCYRHEEGRNHLTFGARWNLP